MSSGSNHGLLSAATRMGCCCVTLAARVTRLQPIPNLWVSASGRQMQILTHQRSPSAKAIIIQPGIPDMLYVLHVVVPTCKAVGQNFNYSTFSCGNWGFPRVSHSHNFVDILYMYIGNSTKGGTVLQKKKYC